MRLACLTCALLSLFFAVSAQPPDFELIRKDLEKVDSLIFTFNESKAYLFIKDLRKQQLSKEALLLLDVYDARIDFHSGNLGNGLKKLGALKERVDRTGDNYIIGNWLLSKGIFHFRKREHDATLALLDSASTILARHDISMNSPLIFSLHFKVLTYHWRLSDVESALLEAQVLIRLLEEFPRETVYHASVHYSMGSIYNSRAEAELARTHIAKSIVTASRLGWGNLETDGYVVIGNSLFNDKQFDKAIPYYTEAIRKIQVFEGQQAYSLINYYNNLGYMYSMVSDTVESYASLYRSLSLAKRLTGTSSLEYAMISSSLAKAHLHFGRTDSAKIYLSKSLQIKESVFGSNHIELAWGYAGMAEFFFEQQLYDSALHYIQKSLVVGVRDFNSINIYNSPSVSGKETSNDVFQLMGRKLEYLVKAGYQNNTMEYVMIARELFQSLDTLLFDSRRRLKDDLSKIYLMDDMKRVLEFGLEVYFGLSKDYPDSVIYMEKFYRILQKSKSLMLVEEIEKSKWLASDPYFKDLVKRERSIMSNLAGITATSATRIDTFSTKRLNLISELDSVRGELFNRFPAYHQLALREHILSLPRLAEILKKKNSLFIEYFVGEDYIYSLVWDGVRFSCHRIDQSEGFRTNLSLFLEILSEGRDEPLEYEEAGFYLYNALVREAVKIDSKNFRAVVIVPDGFLSFLPFEALIRRKNGLADFSQLDYLIRRYSVEHSFSSSLLAKEAPALEATKYRILGLGAYYNKTDSQRRLPGSKRELNSIEKLWEGHYFYEATKGNLIDNASKFDIIHVAVHGVSDNNTVNGSYLEFSKEDRLYASDLYSIVTNARLVVLSACESGLGKVMGGEGVFSVGRAFKFSGAHAVVQSAWRADDGASSVIMEYFYGQLKKGIDSNEALKLAKLSIVNSGDNKTAHPIRWAAFTSYGSVAVGEKPSLATWLLAILGIALFLLTRHYYIHRR
ncbi:CHAT domain-containing tetratricopeptide repeat protein [uncultured Imperialibacter sp.]|uniref:CHAT domain-containing protein n=1 Tax=uncultured Imperialibacter sp. TaxID=1672639 RepID=UPI0030D7A2CD